MHTQRASEWALEDSERDREAERVRARLNCCWHAYRTVSIGVATATLSATSICTAAAAICDRVNILTVVEAGKNVLVNLIRDENEKRSGKPCGKSRDLKILLVFCQFRNSLNLRMICKTVMSIAKCHRYLQMRHTVRMKISQAHQQVIEATSSTLAMVN